MRSATAAAAPGSSAYDTDRSPKRRATRSGGSARKGRSGVKAVHAEYVTGVDFLFVPTTDFERASAFYTDVLGLPRSVTYGKTPGGEFETGNLTLQILEVDKFGIQFNHSPNPVALHVDDVERARAELEAQGVEFRGETMDSGVCHMAFFADPDGNALLLHHRYAPRDA
jgi:catechol 2,3-dioxygenase-like lactoylglutathione lyase family enzyme